MNRTEIIRSDDLRAENRHRILRTLRSQGAITRAKVSQQTGLSQASLSTLLGTMVDQGLVLSESGTGKSVKRGRPTSAVSLNAQAAVAVTISLTMNQIAISLVDYAGNTLSTLNKALKTQQLTETEINSIIIDAVSSVLDKNTAIYSIQGISFGYQGITGSAAGELLWSPIASFDRLPIAETLTQQFNIPVTVDNDCTLIAKALHKTQLAQLGDSFAAVLFSHGVGLGVYLSGEPFTGSRSSALELGHIQYQPNGALCRCGKRGCIEAYAADYGIMRSASEKSADAILPQLVAADDIGTLIKTAASGNKKAKQAFATAGKAIGAGLSTVFTLLDPMPVALVGRNTDAINLMKSEIQTSLEDVGRAPTDCSDLIHCFSEDFSLLHTGLVLDAMAILDRALADPVSCTQHVSIDTRDKSEFVNA